MRGFQRKNGAAWGVVLLLALGLPSVSWGQEARDAAGEAKPPVALDALFKLPSAAPTIDGAPERAGATQREWLERFDIARSDLSRAKAKLEATQSELERLASASQQWQVAAPGGQGAGDTGPLSFRLRQQIRRDREEVEQAERSLTELRVEAELADVPPEWTGEPIEPPVEDARP